MTDRRDSEDEGRKAITGCCLDEVGIGCLPITCIALLAVYVLRRRFRGFPVDRERIFGDSRNAATGKSIERRRAWPACGGHRQHI